MVSNLKVFLIDDDQDDQEIFTMLCKEISPKIQCFVADNGAEALAKLHNDHSFIPDFIFIDINMPLINGVECLIEIKRIHRLLHVPVYMYSTSAEPRYVAKCMAIGAVDFIKKEADPETLKRVISKIFEKQKANAAQQ